MKIESVRPDGERCVIHRLREIQRPQPDTPVQWMGRCRGHRLLSLDDKPA